MVKRLIFLILILMMIFGVSVFRSIIFRSYFPEATSEEIKRSEVLAIAHRGASGHAPENTLAAIIKGVNMNADLVEIDVHLSKDREVVVFHDLTLNRTTNGSGKISETNWSDIEKLDAGSWFSEDFKEEKVPRLIDVLAYFKKQNEGNGKRVKLLIEIKNAEGGTLYKGLAQKTIDLLLQYDDLKQPWCIIQAFNTDYLIESKNHLKSTGVIYGPPLQKLIYTDFSPLPAYIDFKFRWGFTNLDKSIVAVNPNYRSLTKGKVQAIHNNGKQVYTYTVNEVEEMKKLIAMGVDGIITNYPERLVKLKK